MAGIRELNENEEYPLDLLLLADPDENIVRSYVNRCSCYILEKEEDVIGGYLLLLTRPYTLEIINIAVYEHFQGKGYGKKLVLDAIERAKARGAQTIEIGTGNSSLDQLALYQRCGFRIVGIDRDFFIRHYDEPIYENGIQCRDMIRLQLDY